MAKDTDGLTRRYVRTKEAAHFVGLCARTMEKHRTYGTGPRYSKLGGRVVYNGKPHGRIYDVIFNALGVARARVIGVGDSYRTDIKGAQEAGAKGVLIAGGIHRSELLYAANNKGGIDVFDSNFKSVNLGSSAFTDPNAFASLYSSEP